MTEHVVAEIAECDSIPTGYQQPVCIVYPGAKECRYCLGDGRRVLLDTAIPVKRQTVIGVFGVMGHERREVYVPPSSPSPALTSAMQINQSPASPVLPEKETDT